MRILAGLLVAAVAACGGGGGGGGSGGGGSGGGGPDLGPAKLTDKAVPPAPVAGADQLIGTHAVNTAQLVDANLFTTAGQEQAGGRLILNDGTLAFDSAGGFNAAGVASDGASQLISIFGPAEGYAAARMYTGVIEGSGVFVGVFGTEASGPFSGSLSYTGDASARAQIGGTIFDLDEGDAAVDANFTSGRVDVTLSGFAKPAGVPLDTIRIDDMVVDGSRFDGGTVRLELNGATVTPTGADTTSAAGGVLLGTVTGGRPDEVAGTVLVRGDEGAVVGAFVAD